MTHLRNALLAAMTCALTTFAADVRAQPWPSLDEPPARAGGGDKDVALVVSIERYAALPPIEGAERNARAWVAWFERARGLRPDKIVHLRDQEGTPSQILAKARELASLVGRGGRIWFVFIGHGAPAKDQSEGLFVGWAAQASPDELYAQSLGQSELVAALGRGVGAPVVMIVDACFNGTSRSGQSIAKGLQPVLLVDRAKAAPQNVTLMSAGRADQFAGPLPGASRPAFSYLLLGALRGWGDDPAYGNGDGKVTLDEALEFTRAALRTTLKGRSQTPEASGPVRDVVARASERAPDLGRMRDAGDEVHSPAGPSDARRGPGAGGEADLPGYVAIPAGRFTMGAPRGETGRKDDEILHEVRITRPFWMKVTEVTQGEWRKVMGTSPSKFLACGDACPVEGVSWYDAVAFANALSRREGLEACYRLSGCQGTAGAGCQDWSQGYCEGDYRCDEVVFKGPACSGYRLPTEAEWEYAARAGTRTATYAGPLVIEGIHDAPGIDPIAWYAGNSEARYRDAQDCADWEGKQYPIARCGPQPVARKRPNPWGLYDMIGNVWEWCNDWVDEAPSSAASVDPLGPAEGHIKVLRGGSWSRKPEFLRSATRHGDQITRRGGGLGFRLVRTK
ncbi:MAG: SUMF1/EgtB/PvdO family nonheme iron enzyme [Deltaproteobacteria bacterium]|nr:SUMF1/EgtB/PvdO family nonheme iron enzyme [Deltaproteobacteria bacterium]